MAVGIDEGALRQPVDGGFRNVVIGIGARVSSFARSPSRAAARAAYRAERRQRRSEVRLGKRPGAVGRRAGERDERVRGAVPAAWLRRRGHVAGDRRQPFDRLIVVTARAQLIDRLKRHVRILIGHGAEREPARLLTGRRGQRAHRFEPHHRRPILQSAHDLHHAAGIFSGGSYREQSHLRIGIGHASGDDFAVRAIGRRQRLKRQSTDARILERIRQRRA